MVSSGKVQINLRWRRLLVTVFGLALGGTWFNSLAAQFRASVVKIDITPDKPQWLLGYDPRQSTGVHDRLYPCGTRPPLR
jgi:hypothetical protein